MIVFTGSFSLNVWVSFCEIKIDFAKGQPTVLLHQSLLVWVVDKIDTILSSSIMLSWRRGRSIDWHESNQQEEMKCFHRLNHFHSCVLPANCFSIGSMYGSVLRDSLSLKTSFGEGWCDDFKNIKLVSYPIRDRKKWQRLLMGRFFVSYRTTWRFQLLETSFGQLTCRNGHSNGHNFQLRRSSAGMYYWILTLICVSYSCPVLKHDIKCRNQDPEGMIYLPAWLLPGKFMNQESSVDLLKHQSATNAMQETKWCNQTCVFHYQCHTSYSHWWNWQQWCIVAIGHILNCSSLNQIAFHTIRAEATLTTTNDNNSMKIDHWHCFAPLLAASFAL